MDETTEQVVDSAAREPVDLAYPVDATAQIPDMSVIGPVSYTHLTLPTNREV